MIIQKTNLQNSILSTSLVYIVPIPAGMIGDEKLNTISNLLIKDAHNLFINDNFAKDSEKKVVFL